MMALFQKVRGKVLALALVSLLIAAPANAHTTWITPKKTTNGLKTYDIQGCFLAVGGNYDINTKNRSVVVDDGLSCGHVGTRLYFVTNKEYNTIVYWTWSNYRTSPEIATWSGAKSYVEIP